MIWSEKRFLSFLACHGINIVFTWCLQLESRDFLDFFEILLEWDRPRVDLAQKVWLTGPDGFTAGGHIMFFKYEESKESSNVIMAFFKQRDDPDPKELYKPDLKPTDPRKTGPPHD